MLPCCWKFLTSLSMLLIWARTCNLQTVCAECCVIIEQMFKHMCIDSTSVLQMSAGNPRMPKPQALETSCNRSNKKRRSWGTAWLWMSQSDSWFIKLVWRFRSAFVLLDVAWFSQCCDCAINMRLLVVPASMAQKLLQWHWTGSRVIYMMQYHPGSRYQVQDNLPAPM